MPQSCLASTQTKVSLYGLLLELRLSERHFTDKSSNICEKYGLITIENKIIEIHNGLMGLLHKFNKNCQIRELKYMIRFVMGLSNTERLKLFNKTLF